MKDAYMIVNDNVIEIHGFENIDDCISVRFFNNGIVVSAVNESRKEKAQEYIVCVEEEKNILNDEKYWIADNELLVKEMKNKGYTRIDFLYQKSSNAYFKI